MAKHANKNRGTLPCVPLAMPSFIRKLRWRSSSLSPPNDPTQDQHHGPENSHITKRPAAPGKGAPTFPQHDLGAKQISNSKPRQRVVDISSPIGAIDTSDTRLAEEKATSRSDSRTSAQHSDESQEINKPSLASNLTVDTQVSRSPRNPPLRETARKTGSNRTLPRFLSQAFGPSRSHSSASSILKRPVSSPAPGAVDRDAKIKEEPAKDRETASLTVGEGMDFGESPEALFQDLSSRLAGILGPERESFVLSGKQTLSADALGNKPNAQTAPAIRTVDGEALSDFVTPCSGLSEPHEDDCRKRLEEEILSEWRQNFLYVASSVKESPLDYDSLTIHGERQSDREAQNS